MRVIISFPSNLTRGHTQTQTRAHTDTSARTHPVSIHLSGNDSTGNKPPKKEVGQGRLSHKQEVTEMPPEKLAPAKETKQNKTVLGLKF